MPLLKLETTLQVPEEKQKSLLASLSKVVAGAIGKPEQYVMVTLSRAGMLMAGKPADAAFVEIRSIGGLSIEVNSKLAREVCKVLTDTLGLSPERVYLNFSDVEAANWGWNGSTFG